MVIVASNLVGYSHLPSVKPAEGYDRLNAVVVCFLVEITHAYLRDLCCISIRYFVVRCTVFSILVPNLQATDLELGARMESLAIPSQSSFYPYFCCVFSNFQMVNVKVIPVVI